MVSSSTCRTVSALRLARTVQFYSEKDGLNFIYDDAMFEHSPGSDQKIGCTLMQILVRIQLTVYIQCTRHNTV